MATQRHRCMSREDDDDDDLFQQLKAAFHIYDCEHCGKAARNAIPCHGNCGHAYYCSRDCLIFHSRTHRHQCLYHRESQASLQELDDLSSEDDDWLPPYLSSAVDLILQHLRDNAAALQ
ncbi:hypothetical protein H310_07739 [Aphanomyces invadans]|uniref:MYND-type domain-containing protein n=1 Tax=Aphanomyces invadans TaxID=157072 RepID=A0A024U082_9STRA|nr:hypothetical protein H310_07739 [Aphanomyces invadans]ETV99673.1 hypothetical protein H310_07739 [Aphanomyces invadans]RHY27670.1 hypothetical protein DYB32_006633 [Aphanomyces invadans]|eukprot:XP_008871449.1 hypothetical protein H310_07739 [Aphanomyces invadans]